MFKQIITCFWQSTEQWLIYTFQLSTPLSFKHLPYSRGEVAMRIVYPTVLRQKFFVWIKYLLATVNIMSHGCGEHAAYWVDETNSDPN